MARGIGYGGGEEGQEGTGGFSLGGGTDGQRDGRCGESTNPGGLDGGGLRVQRPLPARLPLCSGDPQALPKRARSRP